MSGEPLPRLLTVKEAAAYMRVHPRTLRRWVLEGRLDCLRAGNHIRFDPRSLARWLEGAGKEVRHA